MLLLSYSFLPALISGISKESEWQQDSSGLQHSFLYTSGSLQLCFLDGFDFQPDLQFLYSLLPAPVDRSECANDHWYYLDHHRFFSSLARSKYLFIFSFFFNFHSVVCQNSKIHKMANSLSLFLKKLPRNLLVGIRRYVSTSKSPRILRVSFSKIDFWVVHIPFNSTVKFQFLAPFPSDDLSQAVVLGLVLLSCKFTASAYYVINLFIFFSTI